MRRLCRGLAVFLPILFLAVGVFFFHINPVFAQATTGATNIGTHLIQGDVSLQMKVMGELRKNGLATGDYPIVVMVYPNGDGLTVLTAATGFKPIARLNITCENGVATNATQMGQLASQIPAGIPIVVGNEINNQNGANGEWKCDSYSQYRDIVNAVCGRVVGKNPCGIAALDTINGDYDLLNQGGKVRQNMLNDIVGGIIRENITAIFANVYDTGGCGGYDADRCNVNGGEWIKKELQKRGFSRASDIYITEFGTTTCDSYDCIQEFYETNNDLPAKAKVGFTRPPGQSTGTTWVHTVPAVCQYWEGADLVVQRPSKCGGGKRSAFVYPGIEDMSPDVGKMQQMAAGYTLMCGNQFTIKGDIENEDALKNRPPGQEIDCSGNPPDYRCTIGGVWANIIIDNTKTVIPLYRFQGAQVPNPESEKRRLDDLEGFFSANYTKNQLISAADDIGGDQFLPPVSNGVSRKLIGQEEQCQNTVQYLKTIKALCDNEENRSGYTYNDKLDADAMKAGALASPTPKPTLPPGECALYSKIPTAAPQFDTYKKVLDQMPNDFDCSVPQKARPDWYKEFLKIEITTPKGFKPAYLIHYIDRPEALSTGLGERVNWMSPGEGDSAGIGDDRNISDRIKIVKVYVPATFAEVNIDTVNSNPSLVNSQKQPSFFPTFIGGFMQTIASIIPQDVQTKIVKDKILQTSSILADMVTGGIFNGDHGGIICQACGQKTGNEGNDPRLTIIRRVNAQFMNPQNQTCSRDDLIGETATERIHTINPAGTLDPVKPAKITASATMVAGRPGSKPETIKTFLLLPEEYRNITDYEMPLLQTFVSYDLKSPDKNPELEFITNAADKTTKPKASYKYLQLSQSTISLVNQKFEGADIGYDVTDPNAPPVVDPNTGTITQTRHVDGKLSAQINTDKSPSEIKTDPQVPGGILARSLWEVMCNVTRPYDKIPTIPYPGFEKFLQKGLAACTDGATAATTPPPGSLSCDSTTIPTQILTLKQQIIAAASKAGVPPEMLWGLMRIEGSSTITAVCNAPNTSSTSTTACNKNSVGAVGPFQILSSSCGSTPVVDTWKSLGMTSTQSPCNLDDSLEAAGKLLANRAKLTNIKDINTPARWYVAGGAYHGLCVSSDQNSAGGCSEANRIKMDSSGNANGALCGGVVPGTAPAVSGCGNRNYCQCMQFMAQQFNSITDASVCQ